MHKQQLAYKSSLINYYRFGNSAETLFCLHGYGEDGSSFAFLEKQLGSVYTLYAIDFPHHGSTEWNEGEPFNTNDLLCIFNLIHSNQNKKISLLAYSMGGRAAMHLLQKNPEKIKQLVLIAPDGLHINIWYWLSTQTAIGNKLFSSTMQNPRWFFSLLAVGGKVGIFNKSIIKFVHHFLDDEEQRTLLYKRWTCMRKVKPNLETIKNICAGKNIRLNFLFGKYDRIILSRRAAIFHNAKNISIKIIDAGHQMLREKYAAHITALLND